MVDLVNFFVFPIRKLPILVLDSVELDGNGKSDHQQLKQEDGWGTAAFPFLSPQQGSNYSSDSVSQECIRGVSWCHDHLMVASAGSWFVLCRFSLFCPGEIFSNNTHLPQEDIVYLLEDIFKWWHINPEFRRLPGCQVAGFFWKGFRWPALGLMPTKMQHLSPFNYVQQVIYESNEGSVTHQVSI